MSAELVGEPEHESAILDVGGDELRLQLALLRKEEDLVPPAVGALVLVDDCRGAGLTRPLLECGGVAAIVRDRRIADSLEAQDSLCRLGPRTGNAERQDEPQAAAPAGLVQAECF